MAIARYDQRKTYEEAEANAIGTEYVRADLLPQAEAQRTRRNFCGDTPDLRIDFYQTRDRAELEKIGQETTAVQNDLWRTVSRRAAAEQTPVMAMVATGMNDVLNSQGYTQAAWWNRIPVAAWALMFSIAIFSNAMLGYGARRMNSKLFLDIAAGCGDLILSGRGHRQPAKRSDSSSPPEPAEPEGHSRANHCERDFAS